MLYCVRWKDIFNSLFVKCEKLDKDNKIQFDFYQVNKCEMFLRPYIE